MKLQCALKDVGLKTVSMAQYKTANVQKYKDVQKYCSWYFGVEFRHSARF